MDNHFSKQEGSAAYGGVLTLDLDALVHNYRLVGAMVAPAQMSAVVKANAYGLGMEKIAPTLYHAGCRLFFVAQMIEAYHLRAHLPQDGEIAILNDIQPSCMAQAADAGFLPVLNSLDSLQQWQDLCQSRPQKLPCFVQLDSGMSRLGLDRGEFDRLAAQPDIFRLADVRAVISHLACADEPEHPHNQTQIQRFKQMLEQLPPTSAALAGSAGIFLSKGSRAKGEGAKGLRGGDEDFIFDLVRPGLALYGVDPHEDPLTKLRPVVALSARVAQIRRVDAGSLVGYGGSYRASDDMLVATISVGYADGLHRALGNKGAAFYQGVRLPMIGRISMDSITLDISALPPGSMQRGALVELIGPHQTISRLAQDADTIAYEILTSLGQRFARLYKELEERS